MGLQTFTTPGRHSAIQIREGGKKEENWQKFADIFLLKVDISWSYASDWTI